MKNQIKRITLLIGFVAFGFSIGCSPAQFSSAGGDSSTKVAGGVGSAGVEDPVYVDETDPDDPSEAEEIAGEYECHTRCESSSDKGDRKVMVCHVPHNNEAARHEICISINAVHAHVNRDHKTDSHEDYYGYCK